MYCPYDGKKMKLWDINDRYTASNCYQCPKCGLLLRYRSEPERFEILREGGNPND